MLNFIFLKTMFVISETLALHGYGSVKPQNKNESSLFWHGNYLISITYLPEYSVVECLTRDRRHCVVSLSKTH